MHSLQAHRRAARPHASTRRRWPWIVGVFIVAVLLAVVAIPGGALLRQRVENTLNRNLEGYAAQLPDLRIDVFGLGLRLIDLSIKQEKHPDPPVAQIGELAVTVHWGALLRGNLVADLEIASPRLHIDRRQLQAEAKDEKDLAERGWQEAVEDIHPLEINRLEITDASITYIDGEKERPVQLDDLTIVAENIRNKRSPDDTYPSDVYVKATVFESGKLTVDGEANFLAQPTPAFDVDIELNDVPLDAVDPVSDNVNVRVRSGILAAEGHVEYAPKKQDIYLRRLRIDGTAVEYVSSEATQPAQQERVEKVKEAAKDISNEPASRVFVDLVEIRSSELGYTAETQGYRVFLSDADVTLRNLSSQRRPEPAEFEVEGLFMGAGEGSLRGTFEPVNKSPQFDLDLRIENTPLRTMNDLLQAYGNFDVVAGEFAFYSELEAGDGRITGYVKPLFTDVDAYDARQEEGEGVFKKAYEGVVGGVAELLENPRDDVAAKVDVSGPLNNPNVSTLETVLSLIRNAFFDAILPGFEREVGKK
jgi:hypothetical protein